MNLIKYSCLFVISILVFGQNVFGQCTNVVGTINLTGSSSICVGDLIDARYSEYQDSDTLFWYINNSLFGVPSMTDVLNDRINSVGTITLRVEARNRVRTVQCRTASISLNVTAYPVVPQITVTGNNNCPSSPVSFSISNPEPGVNYSWNFGYAGAPAAFGTSVSHTFPKVIGNGNSNYTVRVTADRNSCTTQNTTSVTVKQVPDPSIIDVTDGDSTFRNCDNASRTNPVFQISLDLASSTTNTNYTISWGDGTPNYVGSSLSLLSHTYNRLGIFNLILTVTGQNGCINSKLYQVINISNPSNGLTNPGSTTGCLPQTFTFLVDTAQTNRNHESTVYDINFGDGSPIITVPHPISRLLTHVFDTSSCGFNVGTSSPNRFVVSVNARNLCASTSASVGGIAIYKAPRARFTMSSDIVCVNSPVTLRNTTILGFNSTCGRFTTFRWSFSDGSAPVRYLHTTPSATVNDVFNKSFSAPGTYIITLSANNTVCDSTLFRDTICVAPLPIPRFAYSFSGFPNIPCTGTQINITNNTNLLTQICSQATYQWSVTNTDSYASCNYPRIGQDFRFVNATNANSINPSIVFNKPGTYRIRLQVNNVCNPSGVTRDSIITIKGRPLINTINGLGNVCINQPLSPSANISSCLSTTPLQYLWTFSGAGVTPSSSTLANPTNLNYSLPGVYTITLIARNECGSDTFSRTIEIYPYPTISRNISNVTICEGESTSFIVSTNIPLGGVTYVWQSSTNNGLTWQNFTNNSNVSGANNDTLSLTNIPFSFNGRKIRAVVINQGICSETTNEAILTVNPNVVFLSQPSNRNVCSNDSTSFRISLSGSSPVLTYQWQESNDGLVWSNISNNATYNGTNSNVLIIQNASLSLDGKFYRVRVTSSGSCIIFSDAATLRVNPNPQILIQPSNSTVCENVGTSFSVTANTTSIFLWQESTNGGITWNTVINSAQRVIVSNGSTSTLSLPSVILNDNGLVFRSQVRSLSNCSVFTTNALLTVNRLPQGQINASDTVICIGDTIQLSGNGGAPGEIYSWAPNTRISSSSGNLIRAFPIINTVYTLESVNSNGCINFSTKRIIVNELPAAPIVNSNSRCGSGVVNLSINNPISGNTYRWFDSAIGGNLISSGTSFTTPSLSSTTNYYVSVLNPNNCESPRTLAVAGIDTIPNVSLISSVPLEFCDGQSRVITASSTNRNVFFKWYRNRIEIVGETSNQLIVRNSGTYSAKAVSLSGACESPFSSTVAVTVNPKPTVTIRALRDTICEGNSTSLIAQGAATYSWAGSALNITTGDSVVVNPTNTSTYTVIGTNSFGCLDTTSITIIVIPNFTINITANTTALCSGSSTDIRFNSSAAGASLRWTSTATAGISGNTNGNGGTINEVLTNSLPTTGTVTYSLFSTLSGCEAPVRVVTMSVNPSPSLTITGTNAFCQSGTTSINLSSTTPGTQFSWVVVNPFNISGASNGSGNVIINTLNNTSTTDVATVTYRVIASANGCSSAPQDFTITIYPRPTFTFNNNTICSGGTSAVNIIASIPDPSIRYQWTVLDSNSIRGARVGNGPTITNTLINPSAVRPDTVFYTVNITSDNCTITPIIVPVIVLPAPKVEAQNQTICANQATNIALSSLAGAGSFSWSVNSSSPNISGATSGTGSSIIQQLFNSSSSISGTVVYAIRATVNGCTGPDTLITVTVNPLPVVSVRALRDTICEGNSTSLIAQGAATYRWIGTALNRTTGDSVVVNPTTTSTYRVIGTNSFGCLDTTSITIIVIPNFTINITANTTALCSGSSTDIRFNSSAAGASLRWTSTATAGISGNTINGNSGTINDVLTNSQPTTGTVTYRLFSTLSGCEAPVQVVTVNVNPSPRLTITGTNAFCQSGTTSINLSSTTPGTQFSWVVVNPINITGASNGNDNVISNALNNTSTTDVATVTYRVIASANGCSSAPQDFTITIYPRPTFTFNNNTICSGGTSAVNIIASIPDPSIRYQWSVLDSNSIRGARVGNGSTITNTLINPSAVRPDTVFYTVNITSDNCTITPIIVPIIVLPAPKVVAQNQTICANQATNIALSSLAGAGNFSWSVSSSGPNISGATSGTGSSIIQQLFNSSSSISGTVVYAIRATVNGCVGVDTFISVTVKPLPLVSLSNRIINFCDTGRVQVNILSSIAGASIQWSVLTEGPVNGFINGTGNTINQFLQNTSRTQIATLKYIVRANFDGCTGPSDTVSVQIIPKPVANFNIELDSTYCVNSSVTFNNTTSTVTGVSDTYFWDFGNGLTSSSIYGETTFNNPGRYLIKLKVLRPLGCIDSITKEIKVVELPQANFVTNRSANSCAPVVISFSNNSSFSALDIEPTWNWDFGNGQTSALRFPPSISYAGSPRVDTSYIVTLTATSRCGATFKRDTIVVSPKPTANFLIESDTVCARLSARIANTTIGQATFCRWNWGDGSPEEVYTDQRSLTHRFIYFGNTDTTYQVKLFASNACGSDSITKNVVVRSNNVFALFNTNQNIGCTPLTVNFRSNQTGANNLIWDFGNGTRRLGGTSQQFTFTNNSNRIDTFKVTLIAFSGICSRDTFTQDVIVFPKPQVSFRKSNTRFCFGDTVRLTNTSNTSGLSYRWDFGDGETSNLTNPLSHFYRSPGRYTIILTGFTANSYRCANADTQVVIIDTNRIVKAEFTNNQLSGCEPLTVTLTKQGLGAINWTWDFGDGNTISNVNPATYTYSRNGSYIPRLKVFGTCNNDSVFGDTVKVFPAPLITFTTSSVTICLGDTLFLNNTSGNDLSFNWSFGDGRTSSFRNPLYHIYSDTGSFNIVLTGRSLIAPFCTGIRTIRIYVAPKPIAEFSVAGGVPLLLCQSNPVNFINRSRLATRYFWDFGISGATSLDPNPTFRYPTSGVFKVTLVAYSEFNCSDTITQFINIYPNPVPSFSLSNNLGCSPLTVNINNLTAYPSAIQGTFDWDFDNGNTHSGYYGIPTQVYTNNSTEIKKFKVRLVCTTTFGCVDTLESEITVYPRPTLGFDIVEDTMYQDSAVFKFINNTTPPLNASYKWNWGDGSSTTVNDTSSINHRYDSVGRFMVKLYILTSNGCLDSVFRFVTVLPVKPRPSFELVGSDTLKGCRPFTIQVRNTSRYSTEYTWDFGDNIIFNNTNPPAITYYNPGVFTIKLTAKNSIGIDSFILRNVVIVDDLPIASFTNNPKTVVIPNQKAYFLNQSTGAVRYLWDFGDNSTSDSISPEHLYTDTGSYNVTLIAYSANGCTDTFKINQAVKAKFDGRIQVPNAFTPGSSFGVNDVFIPVMDGAVDFKMLVFNRWGEIIFESSDSKIGWDGKHRGQICTPDLYPYKIEVVFSNGDKKSLTGKVYLIR